MGPQCQWCGCMRGWANNTPHHAHISYCSEVIIEGGFFLGGGTQILPFFMDEGHPDFGNLPMVGAYTNISLIFLKCEVGGEFHQSKYIFLFSNNYIDVG